MWHITNTREREPPIHTDLPLHELPAPNGAAVSLVAGVDDPNPKLEGDTPKSVITFGEDHGNHTNRHSDPMRVGYQEPIRRKWDSHSSRLER